LNIPAENIRPFAVTDTTHVVALFRAAQGTTIVPPKFSELQRQYVEHAITNEISNIPDFYLMRGGSFWVASNGLEVAGMFGLLPNTGSIQIRRLSVVPNHRRRGLGRAMLDFAEKIALSEHVHRMELSTSEFQREAIALYQQAGYELQREENVQTPDGDIRTLFLAKDL
jgi:GNAT superfamily N-acetyltransferase